MTALSRKRVLLLLVTLATIGMQLISTSTAQSPTVVQTFTTNANKVALDGDYVIIANTDMEVWTKSAAGTPGNRVANIYAGSGYAATIVAMCALGGSLYTVSSNGPKGIRKLQYLSGNVNWRTPSDSYSHSDVITGIAVNYNGVYTSSADGTIKKWNINTGDLVATLQQRIGPSGFFAPIRKLSVDMATNRMYAAFGRFEAVAKNSLGLAILLPSGDFESLTGSSYAACNGAAGTKRETVPLFRCFFVIYSCFYPQT